jgi:uncharacterized protein (TIRG00374 family)
MAFALTPRLLRRGLELFAVISVAGIAGLLGYYLIRFGDRLDTFVAPLLSLHWGWMLGALALAASDWVGGGLRLWVVTRHVHPGVRLRDMILASGMGAWAMYLTPFNTGSSPMTLWVMGRAGVKIPEGLTSIFITFVATVAFLACAGPLAIIFGAGRSLAEHGVVLGITLYDLFTTSLTIFAVLGALMVVTLVAPGVVRNALRWVAGRLSRRSQRMSARMDALTAGLDRARDCVVAFRGPRGLMRLLWAFLISGPSHAHKLLAGYFAMRALGLTPGFTEILLVQAFITFLLYFAPTPGASGLAELISAAVMSVYVPRELTPSYTLIWRFVVSYATVGVGSVIFWHWLRRGLMGREETVAGV